MKSKLGLFILSLVFAIILYFIAKGEQPKPYILYLCNENTGCLSSEQFSTIEECQAAVDLFEHRGYCAVVIH